MSNSFFSSISTKVYTCLGVLATIAAIVGMMTLFEQRYATAADVKQTQAQMVKSMRLININLEVLTLENNVMRLENQKRAILMQQVSDPNNPALKMMLRDIDQQLNILNTRIGHLQNERVTE